MHSHMDLNCVRGRRFSFDEVGEARLSGVKHSYRFLLHR